MANTYDIGDGVRVSIAFTVDDVATDPTTVTLKIKDPTPTTTTYTYALATVTKGSTGNYYKDITIDASGTWYYRWTGTGTVVAATEDYFEVRLSQFS